MVSVLIAGVSVLASSLHSSLQEHRSPYLPTPPSLSGPSSHCTVRQVKRLYKAWSEREHSLTTKERALRIARDKAFTTCWAGDVSNLRKVKKAKVEAKWVRERLGEALLWCENQEGIEKKGYLNLLKPRAVHNEVPPPLFELPWPIPLAPNWSDYTLTVDRSNVFQPPPAYSIQVEDGEVSLDRTEVELHESELRQRQDV